MVQCIPARLQNCSSPSGQSFLSPSCRYPLKQLRTSRQHWCREIDHLPSMATPLQGSAPPGFLRSKIAPVAGPTPQHIKSSPPCCSSCSCLQNFRNGWLAGTALDIFPELYETTITPSRKLIPLFAWPPGAI